MSSNPQLPALASSPYGTQTGVVTQQREPETVIPNLRNLTPTQLGYLADWQRDKSETLARINRGCHPPKIAEWEATLIPFARACDALRAGQRIAGLDTELVENEMPHLVLDALRESRDPVNRGADRLGNRRLLAELGKRVGTGAQITVNTQLNVTVQANDGAIERWQQRRRDRVAPPKQAPAPPGE